jgi:hypothetical protein
MIFTENLYDKNHVPPLQPSIIISPLSDTLPENLETKK